MASVYPEQLHKNLTRLAPVYLVTGDEPLLVQEACDAIRHRAKSDGFLDRELFHADAQFQWSNLLQSANSLGLFAEKKLLEVRLSSAKISDAGRKALEEYCNSLHDDNLLLLVAPKLEKSSKNAKWFKAVDKVGVVVTIWPVQAQQMPRWIEQRLRKTGLKADSQAIETLASRVEGNLLAAAQEIEKLKLLSNGNVIDYATMAEAVVDSARFNVFALLDKALLGDAQAAAKNLQGLKSEGSEPAIILWALAREIRTLINIKHAISDGQQLQAVSRRNGVFDKRVPLIRGALQRLSPAQLEALLLQCGEIDQTIKGMKKGDPWGIILDLTLKLSGVELFA